MKLHSFFNSSSVATLVSDEINNQQLALTGGQRREVNMLLIAVDSNGGIVTTDFEIMVGNMVSTKETTDLAQSISIFPNRTKRIVTIKGDLT